MQMRQAADVNDWAGVDRMLEEVSRQFAGNEWVAVVLEAMRSIASTRERKRAMKEMMYSSTENGSGTLRRVTRPSQPTCAGSRRRARATAEQFERGLHGACPLPLRHAHLQINREEKE